MVHRDYHGRKVRVPPPRPGRITPPAGTIGEVTWAGWDDWYYIHVGGLYLCKARAGEIRPDLVNEGDA